MSRLFLDGFQYFTTVFCSMVMDDRVGMYPKISEWYMTYISFYTGILLVCKYIYIVLLYYYTFCLPLTSFFRIGVCLTKNWARKDAESFDEANGQQAIATVWYITSVTQWCPSLRAALLWLSTWLGIVNRERWRWEQDYPALVFLPPERPLLDLEFSLIPNWTTCYYNCLIAICCKQW